MFYSHTDDETPVKRADSKRDPRKRSAKEARKQERALKYAIQGRKG